MGPARGARPGEVASRRMTNLTAFGLFAIALVGLLGCVVAGPTRAPGKGGRAHRDHAMRRIRLEYPFAVADIEGRWLDAYRERWDLVQ